MKKKITLYLIITGVAILMTIACMLIMNHNPVRSKKNKSERLNTSFGGSIRYGNYISPTEIRDTTLRLKRDTIIDFQWIFRQLYPLQHIGRENIDCGDAYIGKLLLYYTNEKHGRYINCDSINNYIKDVPTDTIFLKETISQDNSYGIYFWHRLDSVYTVTMKKDRLWHLVSFNAEKNYTYRYIDLWMKALLKDLGRNELPPYPNKTTNPYSICATRIILTPDSVFMDMFKFYRPYALEEFYKDYR